MALSKEEQDKKDYQDYVDYQKYTASVNPPAPTGPVVTGSAAETAGHAVNQFVKGATGGLSDLAEEYVGFTNPEEQQALNQAHPLISKGAQGVGHFVMAPVTTTLDTVMPRDKTSFWNKPLSDFTDPITEFVHGEKHTSPDDPNNRWWKEKNGILDPTIRGTLQGLGDLALSPANVLKLLAEAKGALGTLSGYSPSLVKQITENPSALREMVQQADTGNMSGSLDKLRQTLSEVRGKIGEQNAGKSKAIREAIADNQVPVAPFHINELAKAGDQEAAKIAESFPQKTANLTPMYVPADDAYGLVAFGRQAPQGSAADAAQKAINKTLAMEPYYPAIQAGRAEIAKDMPMEALLERLSMAENPQSVVAQAGNKSFNRIGTGSSLRSAAERTGKPELVDQMEQWAALKDMGKLPSAPTDAELAQLASSVAGKSGGTWGKIAQGTVDAATYIPNKIGQKILPYAGMSEGLPEGLLPKLKSIFSDSMPAPSLWSRAINPITGERFLGVGTPTNTAFTLNNLATAGTKNRMKKEEARDNE